MGNALHGAGMLCWVGGTVVRVVFASVHRALASVPSALATISRGSPGYRLGICLMLAWIPRLAEAAPETWCAANPANCVCSDTFQSTSYTRVLDYGNGASFLGDQVGSKPCHYDTVDTSIQTVFANNTFAGTLA